MEGTVTIPIKDYEKLKESEKTLTQLLNNNEEMAVSWIFGGSISFINPSDATKQIINHNKRLGDRVNELLDKLKPENRDKLSLEGVKWYQIWKA